jgi:viroplasmin and RNaseH domain-containing protein
MPRNARKESYYAVARGRARGVYTTWDDAKKQVQNFGGAMHKVRRRKGDDDGARDRARRLSTAREGED